MAATTQRRLGFSWFALVLSLGVPVFFAVAALGTKWGWWPWQVGLGRLTIGIGPILAMAAIAIATLALILGLVRAPRTQPVIIAIFALGIALMAFLRLAGFGAQAERLPPIHDIQTDWSNPIQYSDAIMTARGDDSNPVLDAPTVPDAANGRWPGTGGRLVSELQEEAEATIGPDGDLTPSPYPPLETLRLEGLGRAEVYAAAVDLVEQRGWKPVTADEAEGRIEATVTSGWFGFKDDVAIMVYATDDGVAVDMRSTSRVGLSDLGANSKRVYQFLRDLGANA